MLLLRDPVRFCLLSLAQVFLDLLATRVPTGISSLPLRCLLDSAGHFLTASIAWLSVRSASASSSSHLCTSVHLLEAIIAGFLSSLIDLDHFAAAGSLDLVAATSLGEQRPILHCSTILAIIVVSILAIGLVISYGSLTSLSFLAGIGWGTHHARDGLRRGVWFCGIGIRTDKIPYDWYLAFLLLLPILVAAAMDAAHLCLLIRATMGEGGCKSGTTTSASGRGTSIASDLCFKGRRRRRKGKLVEQEARQHLLPVQDDDGCEEEDLEETGGTEEVVGVQVV